MRLKKYLILLITLVFITGCKEKILTEMPVDIYLDMQNIVEIYSDVSFNDLLIATNANITSDNFKIDTDELGIKEYQVYYEFNKEKYVYDFNIEVVDTTAPRILGSTSKTILLNYKGDLCDLVIYGDNYDKNPVCQIIGSYDLSKVGTYHLNYVITDSSGNTITKELTLKVVKKIENTTSVNNQKLHFADVIEKYQADDVEFGIDVSRWQEDIDFAAVKEAGATFVMMRIGVQRGMGVDLELDAYYLQNIERAKKAGLKVGVYLYTNAGDKEEIKSHALWVIEQLNGTSLELPIVFDWENWSNWNKYNMSFHDLNMLVDTFIETINDHGYTGMLYSSKNNLENMWENKKNYPVWLAHYTEKTNYEGDYIMWQLSNIGRIPGINGAVDIDILYK